MRSGVVYKFPVAQLSDGDYVELTAKLYYVKAIIMAYMLNTTATRRLTG